MPPSPEPPGLSEGPELPTAHPAGSEPSAPVPSDPASSEAAAPGPIAAAAPAQPNNPLHGITLKAILEDLVERRGFEELGELIPIRCFTIDPTLKSSLKFLRKTDWARAKVERLYMRDHEAFRRKKIRNRLRAQRAKAANK